MFKETVPAGKGSVEKNIFDDQDIKQIEELAASLSVVQLADHFKIALTTLYEMFKRQPLAKDSYKKGKAAAIVRVAKSLQEHAVNGGTGNMTAAIFYLKTQGRWSEAIPESTIENEPIETPEEKAARMEDIKLFTEWKNQRNNLGGTHEKK